MRNTGADEDRAGTVQSVDRAVTILELLAHHGELGVTTIAKHLGVHKSTASRLVSALEQRGLVEQVEERGKYRLGLGIVRLAGATTARLDLVQEARPVVRRLAAQTGETVNLVIESDGSALYLDQVSGTSTMSSYDWVGQRIPLHATSNGKILLSERDPAELHHLLGVLPAYTPSTVTDVEVLAEQLAAARQQGYAVATDELDVGLTAVAAAVRNAHGEIAASVSVSGPTFRFDSERIAEVAALVRDAAAEVSALLGWRAPGSASGRG